MVGPMCTKEILTQQERNPKLINLALSTGQMHSNLTPLLSEGEKLNLPPIHKTSLGEEVLSWNVNEGLQGDTKTNLLGFTTLECLQVWVLSSFEM